MTRTLEATFEARAAALARQKVEEPKPGAAGLGARLHRARLDKKLSQAQLAEASGVAQKALSNYERSKTHPDAPTIERLAAALGMSPCVLAFGSKN